jgi:hypothetical protein
MRFYVKDDQIERIGRGTIWEWLRRIMLLFCRICFHVMNEANQQAMQKQW